MSDEASLLLIADDHPLMRIALRSALASIEACPVFLEAATADAVLAAMREHPDLSLVLLDFNMPGIGSVEAVQRLRERHPEIPIAVISGADDRGIASRLLSLGIAGFIPKSEPATVIAGAVRLILAGGVYVPPRLLGPTRPSRSGAWPPENGLTVRQKDILAQLAQGRSNKEIANALGITEGTVKVHLLTIFRLLGVRNRTAAAVSARSFLDG